MGETVIDEDFVLNSQKPDFSRKPGVLSNSQLTTTSKALSYNMLRSYSPGRYSTQGRTVSPSLASELRRSMSPSELKASLRRTVEASRSRSRSRKRFESYNNRLQRSRSSSPMRSSLSRSISPRPADLINKTRRSRYDQHYYDSDVSLEQELDDASFKEKMYCKASDLATWSTDPVHLRNSTEPRSLRNSVRLSRARSRSSSPYRGGRSRSASPFYRSSSPGLDDSRSLRSSGRSSAARLYEEYPITGTESLAKDFFPVTMSAYKINHVEPPMSRSMATSPPPRHLRPTSPHKWRVDGKVNTSIRGLDYADFEGGHVDDVTKMYNMREMAPSIAAGSVHMISPYASDLTSLRLDRLKIEEEHLLEAKRLAEIERLRGPKEKWYELKTPDFHTEAHKNTEMIASKDRWNKLLHHRRSTVS